MITDVATLYELLLAQMAAESYFEDIPLDNPDVLKQRLVDGNNRPGFGLANFTRFADAQATEFLSLYGVVHQESDNQTIARTEPVYYDGTTILANSGLSATMLQ